MPKKKKTCNYCGVDYRGYGKKYCSPKCQYSGAKAKREFTCFGCGKQYIAKEINRDKFCSRDCYFAFLQRPKALYPQPAKIDIVVFRFAKCGCCNNPFQINVVGKVYCGPDCVQEANRQKAYNKYLANADNLYGVHKEKRCQECGCAFATRRKRKLTCSVSCSKKRANKLGNHDARARALLRDFYGESWRDYYEPIKKGIVFKGPQTCSICGLNIDKRLVSTDMQSISLDHVIPLSKGGSHTYDNVQAAHFLCNSRKGDR